MWSFRVSNEFKDVNINIYFKHTSKQLPQVINKLWCSACLRCSITVGVSRQNLLEDKLTPISEQDTVDTHRSEEPKKKQKSDIAGTSFWFCGSIPSPQYF